ncbi:MAG: class I SAM-dependent methyltransferase [Bacillota bacterium]
MKDNSNKKFWDKVASKYSKFMKNNTETFEKSSGLFAPYLNKNQKALEIACGTGQYSTLLADKTASYHATDFSEKMVQIFQKSYQGDKITFGVEDGANLTFPNETFDVVVIANALHIMPNADVVVAEIKRVLKTGGLIIAPTFTRADEKSLRMKFLSLIGFKTYKEWTKFQFENYLEKHSFKMVFSDEVKAKPLSECILIARK